MAVTLDELNDTSLVGNDDPFFLDKWKVDAFPNTGPILLNPIACEQVNLPFAMFQQKTREIATTTVKWPKTTTVQGFTAQFHVDQKLAVVAYFMQWENLIQNPYTGGFRLPSVYKKNIPITLYDNQGQPIHRHTIKNAWPLGLQELSLQGQGGRAVISVTFECDAIIPQPLV